MKFFKIISDMLSTHLELITEQLKEQKLKNEQNGYMLEDLKSIIEIINHHPICTDDIEILTIHFLDLFELKALHGDNLKKYLNSKYNNVTINCSYDEIMSMPLYVFLEEGRNFRIKEVVFHNPTTIVYWNDGSKTVVKCNKSDIYNKEKGLLFAIAKKLYGNEGNFKNEIKKWIID